MTPAHQFIVICEGSSDYRVIVTLVTRTLVEVADWLVEGQLHFRGISENEAFSAWGGMRMRGEVPRRFGHKADGWGPDSEMARRALHFAAQQRNVDAVLLVRDSDKADATRKRGDFVAAVTAFRSTEPSLTT